MCSFMFNLLIITSDNCKFRNEFVIFKRNLFVPVWREKTYTEHSFGKFKKVIDKKNQKCYDTAEVSRS